MIKTKMNSIRNKTGKIIYMVWLSYKVMSTRESLARNSHASHEYTLGYVPACRGFARIKISARFQLIAM